LMLANRPPPSLFQVQTFGGVNAGVSFISEKLLMSGAAMPRSTG
jgi:hypothetical protein